jgi:DNA-binding MarR family transcriptional regulator
MSIRAAADEPTVDFLDSFGLMFRDLERSFSRALSERVGHYGVPIHAFRYLVIIADRGSANPKELADYFGVRSPTIIGTLRLLEAKRLITRSLDLHDARKTVLRLTRRGAQLEQVARKCARDVEHMATRDLSPTQLEQFRQAVGVIRRSLRSDLEAHGVQY